MSSIRTLKPEFWSSESLARCSRDARLTFQGLWTEADCAGRGVANVKVLCGHIWPHDDDITPDVVEEHLTQLSAEHIIFYNVGDKRYYAVLNWENHQAESYRRGNPKHPEPPNEDVHDSIVKNPASRGIEGKGREGKGIEGSAQKSARAHKDGTLVPENFTVTPHLKEWASTEGMTLDLDKQTRMFIDHHAAKESRWKNWDRAWQKWIRQADEWSKERNGGSPKGKLTDSDHSQEYYTAIGAGTYIPEDGWGDPIKLPGEA